MYIFLHLCQVFLPVLLSLIGPNGGSNRVEDEDDDLERVAEEAATRVIRVKPNKASLARAAAAAAKTRR